MWMWVADHEWSRRDVLRLGLVDVGGLANVLDERRAPFDGLSTTPLFRRIEVEGAV